MTSLKELFARHTVTKQYITRIRRVRDLERNDLVKYSFVNAFVNRGDKKTYFSFVHLRLLFAEFFDRVEMCNKQSETVFVNKIGNKFRRKFVRDIRFCRRICFVQKNH